MGGELLEIYYRYSAIVSEMPSARWRARGENAESPLREIDYKKNNMSKDRENGRGNKRARVTRG
jgi:hypothetical protein